MTADSPTESGEVSTSTESQPSPTPQLPMESDSIARQVNFKRVGGVIGAIILLLGGIGLAIAGGTALPALFACDAGTPNATTASYQTTIDGETHVSIQLTDLNSAEYVHVEYEGVEFGNLTEIGATTLVEQTDAGTEVVLFAGNECGREPIDTYRVY